MTNEAHRLRVGVKTPGKDKEGSSEATLVPAPGSFTFGWASWGCNVPLITQALGKYAIGFPLVSQSHRRVCGFTHGHLKASAHSVFLEVDPFIFFPTLSFFCSILKMTLLWSDALLCSLLITATWQETLPAAHTDYCIYVYLSFFA